MSADTPTSPYRARKGFNYRTPAGEVRVAAGEEGLILPADVVAALGDAVELIAVSEEEATDGGPARETY